uniref:28 kDa Metastriate family member n=1 Tax=Rhipicephalus zambeziensis TaxID=60191 RepID=A0A224YB18_9ACAR
MAKKFTKLFLCLFTLRFPGVIFSVSVGEEGTTVTQEKTPQSREWWMKSPPKRTDRPIGQNVSLRAHIFYDSEYLNRSSKRKNIQSGDTVDVKEPKVYFESLFREVQLYLNNQSIMINIVVTNVSEKDFRSESSLHQFDANGTLHNLTVHGSTLGQSNNTIFYYFTWQQNKFNTGIVQSDYAVGYSDADVETNGTFCTEKTSGAVIRHRHRGLVHWATSRATLVVFGSQHFIWFTDEDWKNMNDTFSNCPKGLPTPLPPAC